MTRQCYESRVAELADALKNRFPGPARAAVIAGSGLGSFVNSVRAEHEAACDGLPHVGASTVEGHDGRVVSGLVADTPVVLLCGRRHYYEGIGVKDATILLRALILSHGIKTLIITNAAGGLNPRFEAGDLMLISDHINWMMGNPLRGANNDAWGPRFSDMSDVYSRRLRMVARSAALEAGIVLREGVYIASHGPSYETRAEIAMLQNILGGDAIGMSTAPEAIVAKHMGCGVLGISFISNLLTVPAKTTHDEVMANARLVENKFSRLLTNLIPRL
ncbi:MAG: purine-nucleoside phosphorylase [bacterium]|nr:purine-nucleoside phosphorylase [Candidatus Sumerlaeota bacterium]